MWVFVTNLDVQAERDPEEEGDFMAFEQLMAEAAAKKESKHDKSHHDKKDKKKGKGKSSKDDADDDSDDESDDDGESKSNKKSNKGVDDRGPNQKGGGGAGEAGDKNAPADNEGMNDPGSIDDILQEALDEILDDQTLKQDVKDTIQSIRAAADGQLWGNAADDPADGVRHRAVGPCQPAALRCGPFSPPAPRCGMPGPLPCAPPALSLTWRARAIRPASTR